MPKRLTRDQYREAKQMVKFNTIVWTSNETDLSTTTVSRIKKSRGWEHYKQIVKDEHAKYVKKRTVKRATYTITPSVPSTVSVTVGPGFTGGNTPVTPKRRSWWKFWQR